MLLERDRQRIVTDRTDVLDRRTTFRMPVVSHFFMVMPCGRRQDHKGHQRKERPSGDQSM